MKKTLLVLLLLSLALTGAFSQSVSEDREVKTLSVPQDGRFKLGLLMGVPSGITAGYRFSNWFEANLTGGYNFLFINSGIISGNALFTLANIPLGDAGVLPLSVGPQVNFIVGNTFYIELVGDVRLEYTFQNIPLNLFGEFGFGFRFFDDGNWIAWNGGVGVRYVF